MVMDGRKGSDYEGVANLKPSSNFANAAGAPTLGGVFYG